MQCIEKQIMINQNYYYHVMFLFYFIFLHKMFRSSNLLMFLLHLIKSLNHLHAPCEMCFWEWNTGECNSGEWNTGEWNSGEWNTGECNFGECNFGECNFGEWNGSSAPSVSFSNTKDTFILRTKRIFQQKLRKRNKTLICN